MPVDRFAIVACTANAYDDWVAELAGRPEDEFPRINLLRAGIEDVTSWVMRGTTDVGVTSVVPSHPQFRQVHVFSDRLILCASPAFARTVPESIVSHGWNDPGCGSRSGTARAAKHSMHATVVGLRERSRFPA